MSNEQRRKSKFTEKFVASFLASRCAAIYDEVCANGKYEVFDSLPIEDAIDLAERAWNQYVEVSKSASPHTGKLP